MIVGDHDEPDAAAAAAIPLIFFSALVATYLGIPRCVVCPDFFIRAGAPSTDSQIAGVALLGRVSSGAAFR
jgi:hypothetical protein